MPDILPDCRAKDTKGRVFIHGSTWIPVFCANCGVPGGMCPEENMTFLFYQCDKCHEKYGAVVGTMQMPDEVFWEKCKQEQLQAYGRYLNQIELATVLEQDASPLATLIKGRRV
jgi:hypothetical protein